ncbi:MAG: GFA family protein [Pseudomonadota bacterium]
MRGIIACHCAECRKVSGHYWAATSVADDDLHLERDDGLTWYRSSEAIKRGFCAKCGSTLFYKPLAEDRIVVSAGVLEAGSGLSMTNHAFAAEKGDYYDIADGLPQYAEFTGGERA